MEATTQRHQAWLDQVQESAIEPEREIIDPHHHLWRDFGVGAYLLDDLWRDTGAGHNITRTVFVECGVEYRQEGPEHLRSIGETAFVADIAKQSRAGRAGQPPIAAIVAHSDLRLPPEQLEEALAGHVAAGRGLFRGIRHALACPPPGASLMIEGHGARQLYADPDFQRGVRLLGSRGFTYDSWQYHTQLPEFLALARAAPETPMILDHLSTPLGVDRWAGKRNEVFDLWRRDLAAVAACPNVFVKLGGMAMPDNGWGWHEAARPPDSDEFAAAQAPWYLHAIDCFGPERCMFESNFPVDRFSLSYTVYWNGVKKIVADFTDAEKSALFSGTAARVYGLT
jgi:predicted TIM-barrel fold metal-dependent hydrolase